MGERAVIVVEFDTDDDAGMAPMLDHLREFLNGYGALQPRAVYGAIRDDAAKVLAVFDEPPPPFLAATEASE